MTWREGCSQAANHSLGKHFRAYMPFCLNMFLRTTRLFLGSACSSQRLVSRVLSSLMAFPHCLAQGLQPAALAARPSSVNVRI